MHAGAEQNYLRLRIPTVNRGANHLLLLFRQPHTIILFYRRMHVKRRLGAGKPCSKNAWRTRLEVGIKNREKPWQLGYVLNPPQYDTGARLPESHQRPEKAFDIATESNDREADPNR